jgi:phosphoribosylformimino-5-aminoimidazole carboxamide ribotide isomerase
VIVGLETLPSWTALEDVCAAIGGARAAFSLDLREGAPVISGDLRRDEPPHMIAARAAGSGAGTIIVIDLARVGSDTGVDRAVIQNVRAAAPGVTLAAGGGIRGSEDLKVLADLGCDAVLVASALHDGRIRAGDVAALQSAGRLRR